MNQFAKTIFSKLFVLITGIKFSFGNPEATEEITIKVPGHLYLRGVEYKGYTHMFIEDFHASIMPYTRMRDKKSFDVIIQPENSQISDYIKETISVGHRRYDLKDALCDFIRDATQSIFYYGAISYEVVANDGEIEFTEINPWSLKRIFGNYYQVISKSIARKIKKEAVIISIPKERIFYVGLPEELGSSAQLRRVLERLISVGEPILPKFALESLDFNEEVGFDQKRYYKLRDAQILRMTKKFGWDGRSISRNNLLEYYNIRRYLQYNRVKALIRESVIKELNRIFGNTYGVAIQVSGLPTSSEIDQLFRELGKGSVVFKDIVDKVTLD